MKHIGTILWGLASIVLLTSIAVHAFAKDLTVNEHSVQCSGYLGDLNKCKDLAKAACYNRYNTISFKKKVMRSKGPQYKAELIFKCK